MKKRPKNKKELIIRPLLIALIAVLFLCTTSQAQPIKPNTSVSADYVRSLGTANAFLSAWKSRNVQNGLELISPALKNKISTDELNAYISGTSSPSHYAFEVGSGKKLKDGRYAFDAKLYEYYKAGTPESQSWDCPVLPKIVLVKTGVVDPKHRAGIWMIDELPKPCS
jgi:hypothetical protein